MSREEAARRAADIFNKTNGQWQDQADHTPGQHSILVSKGKTTIRISTSGEYRAFLFLAAVR